MDPQQGGVAQAVRTIIVGLTPFGDLSEVVSLDAPAAPEIQADSFRLHTLGPGRGPWRYSPAFLPWLLENLSRFDAVIVHGLWLYHSYAVHKAVRQLQGQSSVAGLKKRNMPGLFIMPHGMLDPYFQRASGRRLKAWRNWAYWHLIEAGVVNESTGLLFTCETERLLAHEPFTPYRPQRELVVGLGVEAPPPFTPRMQEAFLATCPALHNRPYLLFLSRIDEKKGVDLLINGYKVLFRQLAKDAACGARAAGLGEGSTSLPFACAEMPTLVIAGPGLNSPYGQRLRQAAAELPASAVFFPGMLTGAAKWGAFYGCEAFVLPSHQENFGIAVVEALACSKPVLITDKVNIWREVVANGCGLVADDTLTGTQELLERWINSPSAQKKLMGQRALDAYQNNFGIAAAAKTLSEALKSMNQ
ncbi:glycosyltransferase [Hymenobacter qilianensis]